MKDLNKLRSEIDIIDREITLLFERRMDVVKEISNTKNLSSIPTRDISREQEIIESNQNLLSNHQYDKHLEKLFNSIMEISRDFQRELSEKKI